MCKFPNCACGDECADALNPEVTPRERRIEASLRYIALLWRTSAPGEDIDAAINRAEDELRK